MSHLRKFPYAPRLEYITKNEWYVAWDIRVDCFWIIHTIWIQLGLGLLTLVFQNKNTGYQTEHTVARFS